MDNIFVKSLKKIVQDEGYDIFNDQDRFFAIMADYVGEVDLDNLNCLSYAVSHDILISLGNIYRNPRNASRSLPIVESRIQESHLFNSEVIICFLRCFCDAFGWKNVILNSEQTNAMSQLPLEDSINTNNLKQSSTFPDLLSQSSNDGNRYIAENDAASSVAGKQSEVESAVSGNNVQTGDGKHKPHFKLIFGSIIVCILVLFSVVHFRQSPESGQVLARSTTEEGQYYDSKTTDDPLQISEDPTEYTEESNPGGF